MIIYMQNTLKLLADKGVVPNIPDNSIIEDKQTESGIFYNTLKF